MSGPAPAPYWGQLPVSKVRRSSGDDYSPSHSRKQSLDVTSHPQPRSNRTSLQTAHTDAPTDLSYSPLASPVASTFNASGLAPRPSSQSYAHHDPSDRRKRRSARYQDDSLDDTARATPPAAPDVPRAPPISYKNLYDNGRNSPYTFTASGQPGPPPSALQRSMAQSRAADADADIHHNYPTERQPGAADLESSLQDFDEEDELAAKRAARAASAGARDDGARTNSTRQSSGRVRMPFDDPNSSRRRGSQRQPFADDRSPLQKLELTLDSITKEEKRARVEAAERRAREKAARNAAATAQPDTGRDASQQEYQPGQPQVHFRKRRASVGQEDQRRVVVKDPVEAIPSPATKDTLSRNPSTPRSQIPVPKNRNIPASEKSDLPQRKLSFRERAAKNDVNLSEGVGGASSTSSPHTMPGGGIALARNGSNKLKKNPPGDPWYSQRVEAEERFPTVNRRSDEPEEMLHESRWAALSHDDDYERALSGGKTFDMDEAEDISPVGARDPAIGTIGMNRSVSLGPDGRPLPSARPLPVPPKPATTKSVKFPDQAYGTPLHAEDDLDNPEHHRFRDFMHHENLQPGHGLYRPPNYLDEWKKGTVGTLGGALLDITAEVPAPPESGDVDGAWWENNVKDHRDGKGRRRGSMSNRPKKAEAFDGEYDETHAPTRFKPPLHLKCGPLLRYCGLRHEKTPTRNNRNGTVVDKEIWRGSVMIVTQDADSSYDIVPILRLFVQPIELLPPPPAELRGEQALLPEYVDPIAGIPKLGRKGETLYVRPVEHLEEAKDMSMLDPDDGLFEITRSAPDFDNNAPAAPGSFTERRKRIQVDGEKLGKYKDIRGFRLHAERGCTFWRFNIEVELREHQQRIAYRINRGPSLGFWVPGRGQAMNIMFHSCNGFSSSVNPDDFSGPDPMWRDVLNNHQTRPFHVMIGGGDQIYNDAVMRETKLFREWLEIKNPLHKDNAPFTQEMQDEVEDFYLERYAMWFSQGLFGLANSQIPMVNMYDDHDIIDGFGSYPDHFMRSPVFSGLGAVAFKYYMLFQHQSLMEETEQTEPSWVLGCKPGPYIEELSHSLFMSLGSGLALLAVDARTERTRDEVVREDTWKKLVDRCYAEISKGQTRHLLVLLGVPIAYPRLVWLENILTSRLMDPVKALGKAGLLGNLLNNFDGGVEVLDDLDDHWTAKSHKEERKYVIEDLQDLAADKSVRVTILSGDVHLAAIGQFYSNPKLKLAKHKDFRYMPNIISSAIVNTPPPDLLADVLNKRNKIHHFDKETDENMIPIFNTGVDGKPRNNKRLLPHRNWCAIREYVPGHTPPSTPTPEDSEYTLDGTPAGSKTNIFRRLSFSKNSRGPAYRPDTLEEKDRSRPPMASSGGLFRSLSRRASTSGSEKRPGKLMRTLSLGRGDTENPKPGFFARRFSSSKKRDDGGINGSWGDDDYSEEAMYDDEYTPPLPQPPLHQQQRRTRPTAAMDDAGPSTDKLARMGLRGGSGHMSEFEVGDDAYFTARPPQRSHTQPAGHSRDYTPSPPIERPRPFHRTPTGLSVKQLRKNPQRYEVDVEGGLEVTLNVEVNSRDPAGITVPYRMLIPRLEYEYQGEDPDGDEAVAAAAAAEQQQRQQGEFSYSDEAAVFDDDGEDAGIEGANYQPEPQRQPPPPPARRGSIKRWFSGRRSNSMSEGVGNGSAGTYRDHRWSEDSYGHQRPDPHQTAAAYSEYWNRPGHN